EGQIGGIGQVWTDKGPAEDFTTVFVPAGWLLKSGAAGQLPWAFLTTSHPDQALNYPHVAYVAHQSLELPNGSLQNYTWEIQGLFQVGGGIVDANAKDIITDILI